MTAPPPRLVLVPTREQIARIIDPGTWRVLDRYLADVRREYKGQHAGYDPEAFKDKKSLAQAEEILALIPLSSAPEVPSEEMVERMARAACAEYGDNYDEQPESGSGLHPHDPGLPSREDWRSIVRAAWGAALLAGPR